MFEISEYEMIEYFLNRVRKIANNYGLAIYPDYYDNTDGDCDSHGSKGLYVEVFDPKREIRFNTSKGLVADRVDFDSVNVEDCFDYRPLFDNVQDYEAHMRNIEANVENKLKNFCSQ